MRLDAQEAPVDFEVAGNDEALPVKVAPIPVERHQGKDMVRRFVEWRSGGDPAKRWSEFERLLSSPWVPSGQQ